MNPKPKTIKTITYLRTPEERKAHGFPPVCPPSKELRQRMKRPESKPVPPRRTRKKLKPEIAAEIEAMTPAQRAYALKRRDTILNTMGVKSVTERLNDPNRRKWKTRKLRLGDGGYGWKDEGVGFEPKLDPAPVIVPLPIPPAAPEVIPEPRPFFKLPD